ncbi:Os10g0438301, partial [Oryza sativa Japonica Group]
SNSSSQEDGHHSRSPGCCGRFLNRSATARHGGVLAEPTMHQIEAEMNDRGVSSSKRSRVADPLH